LDVGVLQVLVELGALRDIVLVRYVLAQKLYLLRVQLEA